MYFLSVCIALCCVVVVLIYYGWNTFTKNYPKFVKLAGPYKYVGVSYHRVPNNVRFKLYYPSSKFLIESNRSQSPRYFKDGDEAAKGVHHFISQKLKVPLSLFKSLSVTPDLNYKKHAVPCYEDAPINTEIGKLPLILMSHGMGGSWDFYAQICCNLASFGLIVVMVEHNDGSASHCKLPSGSDFFYVYQHIHDENGQFERGWSRDHTIEFRGSQTDRRVIKMIDVYQYLYSDESQENDIKLYAKIRPNIDFKHLFVTGHSFGGITAVFTAKYMLKQKDSYKNLCCCFVFEPWFEPKDDSALKEEWDLPYLCLIGDRWKKSDLLWNTCTMVYHGNKNKDNKQLVYLNGFTHQDFSDACLFGPEILLRRADCCCKNDTNQNAQDIFVKQCVQFIANSVNDGCEWKEGIDVNKYLCYDKRNVRVESPQLRE